MGLFVGSFTLKKARCTEISAISLLLAGDGNVAPGAPMEWQKSHDLHGMPTNQSKIYAGTRLHGRVLAESSSASTCIFFNGFLTKITANKHIHNIHMYSITTRCEFCSPPSDQRFRWCLCEGTYQVALGVWAAQWNGVAVSTRLVLIIGHQAQKYGISLYISVYITVYILVGG